MVPRVKHACLIIVTLGIACGAPQKVTINTQQEFEGVVVQVIKEVIDIFNADGINCQLLSSDLRQVKGSPKVVAAKEWVSAHPDAKPTVQPKIEENRAELEKASTPGVRQCGVNLKTVFDDMTQ